MQFKYLIEICRSLHRGAKFKKTQFKENAKRRCHVHTTTLSSSKSPITRVCTQESTHHQYQKSSALRALQHLRLVSNLRYVFHVFTMRAVYIIQQIIDIESLLKLSLSKHNNESSLHHSTNYRYRESTEVILEHNESSLHHSTNY